MRLLFNYLSMRDSDPVVRSNKKATKKGTPANGDNNNTKITKFFSSLYNTSANTNGSPKKPEAGGAPAEVEGKIVRKRGRPRKNDITRTVTNGGAQLKKLKSTSHASTSSSTASNSSSISSSTDIKPTPGRRGRKPKLQTTKRKGNSKSSPKLRPRRRASQTYFFKYQLARNPLKAEEEDLKLALLASLQQCGAKAGSKQRQPSCLEQEPVENIHNHNNNTNTSINNKQPKKENQSNHQQQQTSSKQQRHKHPPPKQVPHIQDTVNLQQTTLPVYDEEYLKRYRPDTEDFLTFICFRITAPNYSLSKQQNELLSPSSLLGPTASGSTDNATSASTLINENELEDGPLNACTTTSTGINVRISNDRTSNDYHINLRRSTSPCKSSASNQTASNSSPNHLNSPASNRRRPTRQSPRLASTSNRKTSEVESLNQYAAYHDNQINYEEDMKRAQMALDDMAFEINGSDDINHESSHAQAGHQHRHHQQHQGSNNNNNNNNINNNHHQMNSPQSKGAVDGVCGNGTNGAGGGGGVGGCTSPSGKLLSPYKNNKHLVKGLMTREFAGAFADEEIIFESIKNHKL